MNSLTKNFFSFLEFFLVMVIGFGLFIYSSTTDFLQLKNDGRSNIIEFNSSGLYEIVIYELVAMAIIVLILGARKWSLKDFNLQLKFNFVGVALLLIIIRGVCERILMASLHIGEINLFTGTDEPLISVQVDLASSILVVIINSIYEEALLIGYLYKKLEGWNPFFVIAFSTIIRTSYHTYQGLEGIGGITLLGAVFGIYYWKYQRLWPLILAHAISNTLSLLYFTYNGK